MGISTFLETFEKLESRDITVRTERCVVVRNRNATCRRCAEACTSGAIALEGNEIEVTPDLCVGCGTCATACPTGAISAHRPDDGQLLQSCLAVAQSCEDEVTIVCGSLPADAVDPKACDPSRLVTVACLGRIDESLLTVLIARGIRAIHLVRGDCASCPLAQGAMTVDGVYETMREFARVWNGADIIDLVSELPDCVRRQSARGFDPGRRAFFRSLKGEAKSATALIVEQEMGGAFTADEADEPAPLKMDDEGRLPVERPARRDRLLLALRSLGAPEDDLVETRLFGHVIIDLDACDSCRMCASFCPTGALSRFDEMEGTCGVCFSVADCVKCRCCVDVCSKHALTLSENVFSSDVHVGRIERTVMRVPRQLVDGPHIIERTMRDLLGSENIHER